MAVFIMSFGDLSRYVRRVEPTDNPLQRMINAHSYKDDHHWPWYLEEFVKLGHNIPTTTTDALGYLFSDEFAKNRLLSHELAHLIWRASPAERPAVIEAIEEIGNVLFVRTSKLARDYAAETGVELRYLSEFRLQLGSSYAENNDSPKLAHIPLSYAERIGALECVGRVYALFEAWTDELHRFALSRTAINAVSWAA
jgi:hypothetical protein